MKLDWHYAFGLLWDRDFWWACVTVAKLSISSWLLAGVTGFMLALAKQSPRYWLSLPARLYIWFFRSLPLLVLLIFVYNLPQVIPATHPLLSSSFYAGLVAMVLSESAYMAEIHRGGILSVPKGQYEAGRALGLRYAGIQRLLVVPQAIRIALPALSNEFVTIVKLTSLVSVISLTEILLVGERLYTQNFLIFETLLAVAFYYVLVVTVFDYGLKRAELWLDITRKRPGTLELGTQQLARIRQLTGGFNARATHDGTPTRAHAPILQACHLEKYYGDHHALRDINFTVNPGDVISIIGPSGSGKTSLIRTLNGLERLDGGAVRLHDENFLTGGARWKPPTNPEQVLDIGMVFQSFNLFPHKTALQNVMLAPHYHRLEPDRARLRLAALKQLDKVGLIEHANKYPHQLSGGQQQRVAIARALIMEPSLMLFDEPTSALDPELVGEVLKVLEQLAHEGMTMLIVTHEMRFAFSVSTRVLFLSDGSIIYDATPDELRASPDPQIRNFLRQLM